MQARSLRLPSARLPEYQEIYVVIERDCKDMVKINLKDALTGICLWSVFANTKTVLRA